VNDVYAPTYYALGLISLREDDIEGSRSYFERAYRWSDSSMVEIKQEAAVQIRKLQELVR